ncbi:MAG: hypothetical protein ACI8WB_005387, partial [Phenylobacterium sp.]
YAFVIAVLASFSSFSTLALTKLTASIDKNPVMVNESLILTIDANDSVDPSLLNTSALLRNFVVGNTSTSSQTQIVNGSVTHLTKWTTVLIARTPGNYTIPAITVKGISTQPISVRVIPPAKQVAAGKQKDVFIETSIDSQQVYLQSTIRYVTKLYLGVEIQRGSLTEPKMENANILQQGKDAELSEIKDGKRYRVIQRVYAITPQRSGDYIIKSPMFNGEMVVNQRRSFFSGFNNSKPLSLMGEDINVTVKPIPDSYSGQWLPSAMVALHEQWQPDTQPFTVGEPVTRTITLTAIGVNEEQLPEISLQYPAGVKTYPDQSALNSVVRDEQLISQRKDSVAIVPTQVGELTLPEVKVPWWNTRTNQMQFATLPAKTITIEASKTGNVPLTPIGSPDSQNSSPRQGPQEIQTVIKEVAINGYLTWSFLAAWLITALLWLLHVRHLSNTTPTTKPATVKTGASAKAQWNHLVEACNSNAAFSTNKAMLDWGKARWPEQSFTSTLEMAIFLGADSVIAEVKTLQQQLYSNGEDGQWQGQTLLEQLKLHREPKAVGKETELNPLHPA